MKCGRDERAKAETLFPHGAAWTAIFFTRPFVSWLPSPTRNSVRGTTPPMTKLRASLLSALITSTLMLGSLAASHAGTSVRSYVIQGDTQNWSYTSLSASDWYAAQRALCKIGASRIIGTGDIIDNRDSATQWARADVAYDITDACGLPATLPAGNHDVERSGGTDFRAYDAFLAKRPLHRPLARYGHAWIDRLELGYVVAVLPWMPRPAEVSWLESWLATHTGERAIFVQHEAIEPVTATRSSAARLLTTRFGARIRAVIGGHFLPTDRVQSWPGRTFTLFSNYQLGAVLGTRPQGLVTMLDHYLVDDAWCIRTINYLTGERNRFESPRCL
jgi:hypothetical protein